MSILRRFPAYPSRRRPVLPSLLARDGCFISILNKLLTASSLIRQGDAAMRSLLDLAEVGRQSHVNDFTFTNILSRLLYWLGNDEDPSMT
jgi:hypothetical protein